MKFAGRVDRHAGQVRFRKRYVQRSSFRYGNRRAVGRDEVDVLRILSNVPEERFSGRSRLARRFAEPFPRCAVGVLTDTDCRRQSLVAFIAFLTFLSMIYGDRGVVEKTECVADDGGALDNRNDIGYAVVVLQCIDNGL